MMNKSGQFVGKVTSQACNCRRECKIAEAPDSGTVVCVRRVAHLVYPLYLPSCKINVPCNLCTNLCRAVSAVGCMSAMMVPQFSYQVGGIKLISSNLSAFKNQLPT